MTVKSDDVISGSHCSIDRHSLNIRPKPDITQEHKNVCREYENFEEKVDIEAKIQENGDII